MKHIIKFYTQIKDFFLYESSYAYENLFIFKNFCKRIYRKKYMFDYLFVIKYIITFIITTSLIILNLLNDCWRYSFKIGIFKQSYFSLFVRFKKRNANWFSLLYV